MQLIRQITQKAVGQKPLEVKLHFYFKSSQINQAAISFLAISPAFQHRRMSSGQAFIYSFALQS